VLAPRRAVQSFDGGLEVREEDDELPTRCRGARHRPLACGCSRRGRELSAQEVEEEPPPSTRAAPWSSQRRGARRASKPTRELEVGLADGELDD